MIKQAVILAGGLGTRLRSIVPDLPKCMAPVAGRPFLRYLISYLKQQGINEYIFSLGHKHEIIEKYLDNEWTVGDGHYQCSVEQEPLGTGGAIQLALQQGTADVVAIVNGDTYFDVDLASLERQSEHRQADCVIALKPMQHVDRYGQVEVDEQSRITAFREKRHFSEGLINGGVYILRRASFIAANMPTKFSFEKDYLESKVQQQLFYGNVQDRYFIDIGVPEDFNRANVELANFPFK